MINILLSPLMMVIKITMIKPYQLLRPTTSLLHFSEPLWMDWDMARKLKQSGMDIGGHTVYHPVLSRLTKAEQEAEIMGCKDKLAEMLGVTMDYLAYPVGDSDSYNEQTISLLKQAG